MIPQHEPGRAPRQATNANGADASRSLLTLRQAARLTGVRRRALRERVQRGQVAVRVLRTGRKTKLRLTPDALTAAGLLPGSVPPENPPAAGSDLSAVALLDLVREQNARIASLQEQRFQLAGQLGAALERTRTLEDRVHALTAAAHSSTAVARSAIDIEDRAPDVAPSGATTASQTRPRTAGRAATTAPPDGRSQQSPPGGADENAEPDPRRPSRAGANRRSRWPQRMVAVVRRRAAGVAAARRPLSSDPSPLSAPPPDQPSLAGPRPRPGPRPGDRGAP